jgi:tetratricopeptide (TPR) repeat protein
MTRRLRIGLLSGLVAIGLGACAGLGRVTPYDLGVGLQDRGDLPAATEHYKEELSRHPEHLRARFNLAVIYHDQGNYAAAKEQYRRLLQYAPRHARSLVNLADIAVAEGDPVQAHALLLQAVEAEPDRAFPYSFLGRFLHEQGRLAPAQDAYERALAIEQDALTHYRLGILCLQQGQEEKAQQHFTHAVNLDQNEHHSLYQLALLAIRHNHSDAAARYLQRLTFLTPHDVTVFMLLGKLSLQREQYVNAALYLWEARDLQPDLPEVEHLLLQTYEGLVQQQRAIVGNR